MRKVSIKPKVMLWSKELSIVSDKWLNIDEKGKIQSISDEPNKDAIIIDEPYSLLVPGFINAHTHIVDGIFKDIGWELNIGDGFPGCCVSGHSDNRIVEYKRFGLSNAEPLVFIRDYIGFKQGHPEISEEFRFFHNLYYVSKRNEFIKHDESGEEIPVIRFENKKVLIRLKEIRQFLAIKEKMYALPTSFLKID